MKTRLTLFRRSTATVVVLLSSAVLLIAGQMVPVQLIAAERPNAVPIKADRIGPPPLTAGFMPPEISVPEGFTVELAAGPPLVAHPTFATLDDQGRLFVSENAGVNMGADELEEKLPNSIRMLEDLDGDGRFDRSTVFADKMTFPMGGAWHDGALYVASPPNIWRLEDTDRDGVADQRDVIVNSFGYTGNAASIHGCIPGPDGRLYWCDGYHGHEFKDQDGKVASKREGSYIFSCRVDGSDVRIHCGGGMDNPVEVDFTDEGEMLGTVNIFYTRPRVDCLVHWLYGGAYPHREKVLSELKVTGDVLGPVHRFGHVAVSGTTRYRSGAMDRQWRNNMFATFFNSGKVVRLELEREGSTFGATQREFLSCASREFHPTDVAEDADGSLLVVDTGGWFYRGCPTSQFAKPDVLGGIYRVRRKGMAKQVDPRGNRIDWAKQTETELVGLLGDSRYAVRERATTECARRGLTIVETLKQTLQHPDPVNRLGAVWALTRMTPGSDGVRATIRLALDDSSSSVRQAACRSIATYPDPAAGDRLLRLLEKDEPAIRREAATALGRIGDPKAVPVLLASLDGKVDRAEQHTIVYALIEIDDAAATRAGLTAAKADAQRGALIALDQMDSGNLTPEDVVPLVAANDVELQRAAALIFAEHADWASRSAEVIASLLRRPDSIDRTAAIARKLMTKSLADDAVGKLMGRILTDSNTTNKTRDLLLASIADGQAVPLHASWVEPLKRMLVLDDPKSVERTLAALAAIKSGQFHERLKQVGADESLSALLRVAAHEAVAGRRGRLTDSSLDLLIELLEDSPGESLRAAQRIGAAGLSKSQLIRLAPQLALAGPSQLNELIRPFQRSKNADVAKEFLMAMENARSLTSLPPHEFSNVILRYPRELLPVANKLFDRIRQEEQQRLTRLDKLLPLLPHGDAKRGRELFFAEKSKCATCHRVAGKGGKIGPDLTTIGANRAARDLLESIVLPSATIVRDFEMYSVVTTDGQVLNGLIVRETRDAVHVQQPTGDPIVVARDDIEEIITGTVSIMPNGLEKALTESDLSNIIAFLQSLKQPTAKPPRRPQANSQP